MKMRHSQSMKIPSAQWSQNAAAIKAAPVQYPIGTRTKRIIGSSARFFGGGNGYTPWKPNPLT